MGSSASRVWRCGTSGLIVRFGAEGRQRVWCRLGGSMHGAGFGLRIRALFGLHVRTAWALACGCDAAVLGPGTLGLSGHLRDSGTIGLFVRTAVVLWPSGALGPSASRGSRWVLWWLWVLAGSSSGSSWCSSWGVSAWWSWGPAGVWAALASGAQTVGILPCWGLALSAFGSACSPWR